MSKLHELQSLVWIAFFTAIITVSAFIAFPLGPIPFTLQVLMIFLCGLVLGPKHAFIALLLYLVLGAIGLPIFSGGKSGIGAFLSPTGGFLIGFLPMVYIAGFAKKKTFFLAIAIMVLALAVLYVFGIAWFMYSLKASFEKAFYATTLPFIPFDIAKIILAYVTSQLLYKKNWINL